MAFLQTEHNVKGQTTEQRRFSGLQLGGEQFLALSAHLFFPTVSTRRPGNRGLVCVRMGRSPLPQTGQGQALDGGRGRAGFVHTSSREADSPSLHPSHLGLSSTRQDLVDERRRLSTSQKVGLPSPQHRVLWVQGGAPPREGSQPGRSPTREGSRPQCDITAASQRVLSRRGWVLRLRGCLREASPLVTPRALRMEPTSVKKMLLEIAFHPRPCPMTSPWKQGAVGVSL